MSNQTTYPVNSGECAKRCVYGHYCNCDGRPVSLKEHNERAAMLAAERRQVLDDDVSIDDLIGGNS